MTNDTLLSLTSLPALTRAGAGVPRCGILAVDPGAFQVLVGRGSQGAAACAAVPADDLAGPAARVAATFPLGSPGRVRGDRSAILGIPEEGLAGAVTLHAHRHRGERRRAQLRRADRLAVAGAHTLQEILP